MGKRILQDIEPKGVLKYFEDLSQIPRCSANEKEASEYLLEFAKKNKLESYKDEIHNVVIKKEASKGHEDYPTVILQGHVDMVCEKNKDTIHDFEKDPIKLIVDGDKVCADGTTLGADNGLGVAMILAILADEGINHPRLEAVITTNEETGMFGAEALDKSKLEGEILINLDANDEGYFVVGCAGGPAILTEIPIERTEVAENYEIIKLEIRGLTGGHSGEDIHRGRANAIKLMGRALMAIDREMYLSLVELDSGVQYNAIPREADAVIMIAKENMDKASGIVETMNKTFKNEYRPTDKKVELRVNNEKQELNNDKPLSKESKDAVLNYLYLADTGIIRMNQEFANTVESSLSVGVAKLGNDKISIQTLVRSSLESMYMEMYYKILKLTEVVGGKNSIISNCPEWEYNPESKIKDVFQKTYTDMYGKDSESMILHAGLECGMFSKNRKRPLDMIAAGPDIRDLHTPVEYFSISSLARFWEFMVEVLNELK